MKQNNNAQPVQDVIRKLRFSFKEKGMLIGGSMFDKDESAKSSLMQQQAVMIPQTPVIQLKTNLQTKLHQRFEFDGLHRLNDMSD